MDPELFTDAPAKQLSAVRRLIPKKLQPMLRGLRKIWQRRTVALEEPFKSVYTYTQAHIIRQQNLLRLAREIESHAVPGAIVECGVLDGGTAALMAYGTQNRSVHLFDSWEGLPSTTTEDGKAAAAWAHEAVGSPRRVVRVMRKLGIPLNRIVFHKGWFESTFPKVQIDRIALLHIDADFYASVRLCLEKWAPKMSPGGFIQFDDYSSFVGCRKAVDEYLATQPHLKLQSVGESTRAYFVKL